MPRIVHFDLPADDPISLKKFYEDVFEWKFDRWVDPTGQMEYWLITTGPDNERGINGGMGVRTLENPHVSNTIEVENITEYIEKIKEHGGTILLPKMLIPDVGWMATFKDPQNNTHMLIQKENNEEESE